MSWEISKETVDKMYQKHGLALRLGGVKRRWYAAFIQEDADAVILSGPCETPGEAVEEAANKYEQKK